MARRTSLYWHILHKINLIKRPKREVQAKVCSQVEFKTYYSHSHCLIPDELINKRKDRCNKKKKQNYSPGKLWSLLSWIVIFPDKLKIDKLIEKNRTTRLSCPYHYQKEEINNNQFSLLIKIQVWYNPKKSKRRAQRNHLSSDSNLSIRYQNK